jgi:hypothetical protein
VCTSVDQHPSWEVSAGVRDCVLERYQRVYHPRVAYPEPTVVLKFIGYTRRVHAVVENVVCVPDTLCPCQQL